MDIRDDSHSNSVSFEKQDELTLDYGTQPAKRSVILTRALRFIVVGYVLLCAIMDFVPRYGPPNFRYNGADPAYFVWNFGWPFASWIYDDRSGFHEGPIWWFPVAVQVFLLVAWSILRWIRRFPNCPAT